MRVSTYNCSPQTNKKYSSSHVNASLTLLANGKKLYRRQFDDDNRVERKLERSTHVERGKMMMTELNVQKEWRNKQSWTVTTRKTNSRLIRQKKNLRKKKKRKGWNVVTGGAGLLSHSIQEMDVKRWKNQYLWRHIHSRLHANRWRTDRPLLMAFWWPFWTGLFLFFVFFFFKLHPIRQEMGSNLKQHAFLIFLLAIPQKNESNYVWQIPKKKNKSKIPFWLVLTNEFAIYSISEFSIWMWEMYC